VILPTPNRRWLALAGALFAACASNPPEFEEVAPADELYQQGLEHLEGREILWLFDTADYEDAIETFQAIIDNYPYSDFAVLAELRIADAYFDDGKYEEALSYYRDFADLHPQHEKVPYTVFRAALCHERRMRSAERDQTATREALVYLDRLLSKYPHSEYAAESEELWRSLRTQLADNVRRIADYYMRHGEYESAAERYRSLLNDYPGLGLDAQALYKLAVCYAAMNRGAEAEQIFLAIVQNFQDTEFAEEARDRIADAD
jgi:outer membrane protein assembly factor BamD